MPESLTSRVGRIISASLHALLNTIQNSATDTTPETVMEQAIQEIDSAIEDVRTELGGVLAAKHLAATRLADENRTHQALAQQIQTAVIQQRDELAEAAIARQLDIEAQLPVLEAHIEECRQQAKQLEAYIKALQAKKREMAEELNYYRMSHAERIEHKVQVKTDKVDTAFAQASDQTMGARLDHEDIEFSAKIAELDDMSRSNRIKERLAAVKNKVTSR